MTSRADIPPRRIETERLVIRPCRPDEAHLLREAIDSSLEHLRAWMPWAMHEPRSLAATREHLETSLTKFEQGEDFSYQIFRKTVQELFGGIGLHRRSDADCLEIGYWIRADQVERGYATEAAAALTTVALGLPGITRVQIECDPANRPSARIPEKLGYELIDHRIGDKLSPLGEPRDTLVYELRDVG